MVLKKLSSDRIHQEIEYFKFSVDKNLVPENFNNIPFFFTLFKGYGSVLDFPKKILGPAGPQVFICGRENKT